MRAVAALLLLAVLTAGCDWMVSGEGVRPVSIVGPGEPFGSAVVVVSGDGVLAVEGDAGTRIVAVTEEENRLRAVVVQPRSGGTLQFGIRVRDRSGATPSVEILQVADLENEALAVTSAHRVLIGR